MPPSKLRGNSLDHANEYGAHGLTPSIFPRGLFETPACQERYPIIGLMLKNCSIDWRNQFVRTHFVYVPHSPGTKNYIVAVSDDHFIHSHPNPSSFFWEMGFKSQLPDPESLIPNPRSNYCM